MFQITDGARDILGEVIKKEQQFPNEELFVRLSMGIGWGSPKLNLSLEERTITGDLLFEFEAVKIIIHEQDFRNFDQKKLDYGRDVQGNSAFKLIKI